MFDLAFPGWINTLYNISKPCNTNSVFCTVCSTLIIIKIPEMKKINLVITATVIYLIKDEI